MSEARGRWRINDMRMGLGWNASMGGLVTDSLPVEVVPCDDAAVERAALWLSTMPPVFFPGRSVWP